MDNNAKIIGKGTWIDKLASELINREKNLGRNTKILRVESGLGASGIPHIGSLGDAVRAYGVKLALENLGYRSELIAYSDDMDGLRSIPDGFPKELYSEIGKAVSEIYDPFGCHDSYGIHMSSLLLDGLNKLGIKYIFRRAKETYKNHLLQNETHKILLNHKIIGSQIKEITGQTKYTKHLPYFPVCNNCNKLYTTFAYDYITSDKKVMYQCKDTKISNNLIKGCHYKGESDITRDMGKLAWKVEFAARWSAFDIRFEAYGKDIMSSVMVNDWVSDKILEHIHPYHVRYEMLLDKKGKKISKSSGNVITHENWLKYGTTKTILLLLYKRISGSREIGFEDIPSLMNEYDELEDVFFDKIHYYNKSKIIRLKGLYEYVNLLNPPKNPSIHIDYRLLVKLNKIFKKNQIRMVTDKLNEYGIVTILDKDVESRINMAVKYANDFELEHTNIKLDKIIKVALKEFADFINKQDLNDDILNIIYKISKKHNIKLKNFFIILYQIIISSNSGPRIDKLINDIGKNKVAESIQKVIKNEK